MAIDTDGTTSVNIPDPGIDDLLTPEGDRSAQLDDFIQRMSVEKEKIENPAAEGETGAGGDAPPEEGDSLGSNAFVYTEEDMFVANLLLNRFDTLVGFSFSLITGMDEERYMRKRGKYYGDEVKAVAALIHKYRFKPSIEMIVIVSLVIAYAPSFSLMLKDAKRKNQPESKEPVMRVVHQSDPGVRQSRKME